MRFKLMLIGLALMILVGCAGSSQAAVETAIAETAAAVPTETATLEPTDTPEPTATERPTATPTEEPQLEDVVHMLSGMSVNSSGPLTEGNAPDGALEGVIEGVDVRGRGNNMTTQVVVAIYENEDAAREAFELWEDFLSLDDTQVTRDEVDGAARMIKISFLGSGATATAFAHIIVQKCDFVASHYYVSSPGRLPESSQYQEMGTSSVRTLAALDDEYC